MLLLVACLTHMLEDTNEKEKAHQGLIGAVTAASFPSSLFVVVVIIIIISVSSTR
jgi:hypothetical protein